MLLVTLWREGRVNAALVGHASQHVGALLVRNTRSLTARGNQLLRLLLLLLLATPNTTPQLHQITPVALVWQLRARWVFFPYDLPVICLSLTDTEVHQRVRQPGPKS